MSKNSTWLGYIFIIIIHTLWESISLPSFQSDVHHEREQEGESDSYNYSSTKGISVPQHNTLMTYLTSAIATISTGPYIEYGFPSFTKDFVDIPIYSVTVVQSVVFVVHGIYM